MTVIEDYPIKTEKDKPLNTTSKLTFGEIVEQGVETEPKPTLDRKKAETQVITFDELVAMRDRVKKAVSLERDVTELKEQVDRMQKRLSVMCDNVQAQLKTICDAVAKRQRESTSEDSSEAEETSESDSSVLSARERYSLRKRPRKQKVVESEAESYESSVQ